MDVENLSAFASYQEEALTFSTAFLIEPFKLPLIRAIVEDYILID